MELLRVAYNYEERGQKVCVVKPSTDKKAGTKLSTRIGIEREVDFCVTRTEDLRRKLSGKYDCILVDEAQFLTRKQVDQLMEIVAKRDIPVICFGLRLNFRQDDSGFEGATRLLQIAHEITEVRAICDCGRRADRTTRFLNGKLVTDGPDILIDDGKSKIEYRSLCTHCYFDYLEGRK